MSRFVRPSAVLAVALAVTPASLAATITLTPGQNIQAAINSASPFDVINLMPGEYQQTFVVDGKLLTIKSDNPANPAVLNGVDLGSVITLQNINSGPFIIQDLVIENGNAAAGGGGLDIQSSFYVRVLDCTFQDNDCANPGGGVRMVGGSRLEIIDCTFVNNRALGAGADGGGMHTSGVLDVLVRGSTFAGNTATNTGGAARFDNCDAQVTDCVFWGNAVTVEGGGGALWVRSGTELTIDACLFRDNSGPNGGAIEVWTDNGSALVRNSVFRNNTADTGGAISKEDPIQTINCTFENNTPDAVAGAGTLTMRNSITWNSGTTPLAGPLDVKYSLVQHGQSGAGNNDADPLFTNAVAGDYTLQPGSPAIDAGDTGEYCGPMIDRGGLDRAVAVYPEGSTFGRSIIGPVVDMGAFEHQTDGPAPDTCPADTNGDDEVDVEDLVNVITTWGLCP